MSRSYNWRNTLRDFASISGVLAGFCVAFIGIVLGWSLADVRLHDNLTFGNISILFFGIATVLFISASEFLLHSKNYDVFEYSKEYREWLEKGIPEENWDAIYKENNQKIKSLYKCGSNCYNCAVLMLYLGLLFVLLPYSVFTAVTIFVLGIILQLFQSTNMFTVKLPPYSKSKFKAMILIAWILIIIFIAGYIIGYSTRLSAQRDVEETIVYYENVSLGLSSSEVLDHLKQLFPQKLNYTQLLEWESTKLAYATDREWHDNPVDILNYGKGACGEFSILYVAVCLANDVPARLVTPAIMIPGVIDHVWVEVNSSNDGKTWIHVDPTDSCVGIQLGKSIDELTTINNPSMYRDRGYTMIFAFEITQDRTNPNNRQNLFLLIIGSLIFLLVSLAKN